MNEFYNEQEALEWFNEVKGKKLIGIYVLSDKSTVIPHTFEGTDGMENGYTFKGTDRVRYRILRGFEPYYNELDNVIRWTFAIDWDKELANLEDIQ